MASSPSRCATGRASDMDILTSLWTVVVNKSLEIAGSAWGEYRLPSRLPPLVHKTVFPRGSHQHAFVQWQFFDYRGGNISAIHDHRTSSLFCVALDPGLWAI